jgi:peptidoglycan/LPS O-acetylase OafA/YrhL
LRGLKDGKWLRIVDTTLKWILPLLWLLTYVRTQPQLWMPITGAGEPGQTLPYVQMSHGWDTTEGFVYGLIPLTLLALGLRQDRWRTPWLSRQRLHSLSWIGDISYSLYLLHFPVQIAVMIWLARWPYEQRVAVLGSPWFFIAFMTVTTVLARWSYTYFEMPARKTLKTFLTKRLTFDQAKAA